MRTSDRQTTADRTMHRSSPSRAVRLVAGCLILVAMGCGRDPSEAKTSNFEHDHEVAPHWPDDLPDAVAKIRERLAWLEDGAVPTDPPAEDASELDVDAELSDPASEIADLVGWVPEIAADTYLSEQDWIPLDAAATSLSDSLKADREEFTESHRQQTLALCEQIEQTLSRIPDQMPYWSGSSP